MRILRYALCSLLAVTQYALAQTNTTAAALTGAGAGAALGAGAGAGGTTSSSLGGAAGGGSSSPIEIQVMVYNGLAKIAHNIAAVVYQKRAQCKPVSDKDGFQQMLDSELKQLHTDTDQLNRDMSNPGQATQDLQKVKGDLAKLDTDAKPTNGCSILVEDTTSANQVALYQSLEGYYENMKSLYDSVQDYFSLLVEAPSRIFAEVNRGQTQYAPITLKNVGNKTLNLAVDRITTESMYTFTSGGGNGADVLDVQNSTGADKCGPTLEHGRTCIVTLSFTPPANSKLGGKITGSIRIPIGQTTSYQVVKVSVSIVGQTDAEQANSLTNKLTQESKQLHLSPRDKELIDQINNSVASMAGGGGVAPPTTGTSTSSGATASTPIELTYLSGIMSALGTAKSGITYTPSSFQPTTQSLMVLIEAELASIGITPYTSTSALNVAHARTELTYQLAEMLNWGSNLSNWATLCKPPSGTADPTKDSAKEIAQSNTSCDESGVTTNIAVAQQTITGYTSLITTANDGSGNAAIVAILHGKVLSDKMKEGIPSLQVAVAGAGGSARSNIFFLLNLFYTPKPSYNAGVIATFELRDKDNNLEASGARNVLFDYKKWKPSPFEPSTVKVDDGRTACTFCSAP